MKENEWWNQIKLLGEFLKPFHMLCDMSSKEENHSMSKVYAGLVYIIEVVIPKCEKTFLKNVAHSVRDRLFSYYNYILNIRFSQEVAKATMDRRVNFRPDPIYVRSAFLDVTYRTGLTAAEGEASVSFLKPI